jgi:hypothetical protein
MVVSVYLEFPRKSLSYYKKFVNDKQPDVTPFNNNSNFDILIDVYKGYDEDLNEIEVIEKCLKSFKKKICSEDKNFLSETEDGLFNSSGDKTFVETRIRKVIDRK